MTCNPRCLADHVGQPCPSESPPLFAGLPTPAYGGELSARELVDALRAERDQLRAKVLELESDIAEVIGIRNEMAARLEAWAQARGRR